MFGCESWTLKKAERWIIDAFELWCWSRLLRVPWTARRANLSILKEIGTEYSLKGLMLKLKLLILWPPDEKNWLIWKDPDAGKEWRQAEGEDRRWDGWMASLTQWTWVWVSSGVGDGQGGLACCSPWGCKQSDTTELLTWTTHTRPCVRCWRYGNNLGIVVALDLMDLFGIHISGTSGAFITDKHSKFSSVQFSRSVVSDSSWPHEPQHTRPPCPSPTPGVQPNPCPSSRWCHPTISSSVILFSSFPQSFPASGSFQMSQLFALGDQSTGVSASTSVLPMNT